MASPNYSVLQVDTTNARTVGEKVVANGDDYDGVTVLAIPGGLVASLALGDSRDFIPILQVGQVIRFKDVCNNPFAANEGLIVRNNAVVGTLLLLISRQNQPRNGGQP